MDSHQQDSLLAEYEAAIATERAAWEIVRDETAKPTERVVAYARWRRAADRVKELADQLVAAGKRVQQPATPRNP